METNFKYPNKAGIYKITCIDTGKIYIGKAVNLRKRITNHKSCVKTTTRKFYFQNALVKHGWDSFIVEILEIFEDFDKVNDKVALLEREAYYIELFDSTNIDKGYNLCKYSTDTTGIPLSEEHKEKLRQAKLGKPMPEHTKECLLQANLGKPRSNETKEKISKARKGMCFSDETREKMRQARLGKPMSEDNKEKLRQSHLGKKMSDETKEKIRLTKQDKKQ